MISYELPLGLLRESRTAKQEHKKEDVLEWERLTMIPITDLISSEVDDAEAIADLGKQATAFLSAHHWCRAIRRGFFDRGWAGILAVFYFEIEPDAKADRTVWIIVGNLPPAYIDTESCPNGAAALDGYAGAMQEWVERVRAGKSVDGVIPVYHQNSMEPLPATAENAELLDRRVRFIRECILPEFPDELAA